MRLRIGLAALLIAFITACAAAHRPVVDTGPLPAGVGGTIAGMVRTSAGEPLSGRKVTATDVGTGARYEAATATNGGYTMKVPTGTYRLDVELRAGETLAEKPADTDVNTSDLDAQRNFVVTRS